MFNAQQHVFQIAISAERGEIAGAAEEAALAVNAFLAKVGVEVAEATSVQVAIGNSPEVAYDDEPVEAIGFRVPSDESADEYEFDDEGGDSNA